MSASPILVTGFGPFEGVTENPSGAVAECLMGTPGIRAVVLPVTFDSSASALDEELDRVGQVAAILCIGVHPGTGYRLERRARPTLRLDRPDTEGVLGAAVSGAMGGGDGDLFCDLDLEAYLEPLRAAGAEPLSISENAGGYVCERIYRHALVRAGELAVPALFLHVPPIEAAPVEAQTRVARALLECMRSSA